MSTHAGGGPPPALPLGRRGRRHRKPSDVGGAREEGAEEEREQEGS